MTLDVDRDHDLGLGIVLVSGVGQTDLLLTLGDGGIGQQTGLSARNRHPILTGAAQRSARCRGVVLHRQRGIRRLHGLYNRPDDCVLRSGRVERAVLAVDQRDGNAGVQLNAGGQLGLLLDGILLGRTRNADLILSVSVGSECGIGIGSGDSQLLVLLSNPFTDPHAVFLVKILLVPSHLYSHDFHCIFVPFRVSFLVPSLR